MSDKKKITWREWILLVMWVFFILAWLFLIITDSKSFKDVLIGLFGLWLGVFALGAMTIAVVESRLHRIDNAKWKLYVLQSNIWRVIGTILYVSIRWFLIYCFLGKVYFIPKRQEELINDKLINEKIAYQKAQTLNIEHMKNCNIEWSYEDGYYSRSGDAWCINYLSDKTNWYLTAVKFDRQEEVILSWKENVKYSDTLYLNHINDDKDCMQIFAAPDNISTIEREKVNEVSQKSFLQWCEKYVSDKKVWYKVWIILKQNNKHGESCVYNDRLPLEFCLKEEFNIVYSPFVLLENIPCNENSESCEEMDIVNNGVYLWAYIRETSH